MEYCFGLVLGFRTSEMTTFVMSRLDVIIWLISFQSKNMTQEDKHHNEEVVELSVLYSWFMKLRRKVFWVSLQMKPIYCQLLLVITSSPVCNGIVGSQPAANYPFFVLVLVGDHFCGGTVVGPEAVLSSASCLIMSDTHRWAPSREVKILHGEPDWEKNISLVVINFCEWFWLQV